MSETPFIHTDKKGLNWGDQKVPESETRWGRRVNRAPLNGSAQQAQPVCWTVGKGAKDCDLSKSLSP